MSNISFDPVVFNRAGYVTLAQDPAKVLDPLDQGLSYLVFVTTYTKVGRDYWVNNKPYGPGQTPAIAKNTLLAILQNAFPNVAATDREALIDAHIAASLYLQAKEIYDPAAPGPAKDQAKLEMDRQEYIYKQKMAFI